MTGNQTLDIIFAIQGVIVTLCTLIGLIAPKGSVIGGLAAKIGHDVKSQTVTVAKIVKTVSEENERLKAKELNDSKQKS